jgi:hypothetical protein
MPLTARVSLRAQHEQCIPIAIGTVERNRSIMGLS